MLAGRTESNCLLLCTGNATRSYCGSEIGESEIYSPYSFCGSEAASALDISQNDLVDGCQVNSHFAAHLLFTL